MKITVIAATLAALLSATAALADHKPAPAQKADPSESGDPAQAFRTCIGRSLHEVETDKEYELVRYAPGTYYIGSRVWLSTGSEKIAGVEDCLKQVAAKKH